MDDVVIKGKRPKCIYCQTDATLDILYCAKCNAPQHHECWIANEGKCGNCGYMMDLERLQRELRPKKLKVVVRPMPLPPPPNRTKFGKNVVDKRDSVSNSYSDLANILLAEGEVEVQKESPLFVPVITRIQEYICGFVVLFLGLSAGIFSLMALGFSWGPWMLVWPIFFFTLTPVGYYIIRDSDKHKHKSYAFVKISWLFVSMLVGLLFMVFGISMNVATSDVSWLCFVLLSISLVGIGIVGLRHKETWYYGRYKDAYGNYVWR